MERFAAFALVLVFTVAGCGSYNSRQVSLDVPKDLSYCQRIDDMAVGLEPYMAKEKTILVFDNDLGKEEVMALNISMIADGDKEYVVSKDGIRAIDEFGNEYSPMAPAAVAERIDRALRADAGLASDLAGREMPDEVTVSRELAQHFLYYDMKPNHAESREFTVYVQATSTDGMVQKAFSLTVDPLRGHMNPAERWDSYDARGVTPCMAQEKEKMAEAAPAMTEEEVERAEEAAEKQERIFEKQMMK